MCNPCSLWICSQHFNSLPSDDEMKQFRYVNLQIIKTKWSNKAPHVLHSFFRIGKSGTRCWRSIRLRHCFKYWRYWQPNNKKEQQQRKEKRLKSINSVQIADQAILLIVKRGPETEYSEERSSNEENIRPYNNRTERDWTETTAVPCAASEENPNVTVPGNQNCKLLSIVFHRYSVSTKYNGAQ